MKDLLSPSPSMEELFEQFKTERRWLRGISKRTERSYHNAERALFAVHKPPGEPQFSKAWFV